MRVGVCVMGGALWIDLMSDECVRYYVSDAWIR